MGIDFSGLDSSQKVNFFVRLELEVQSFQKGNSWVIRFERGLIQSESARKVRSLVGLFEPELKFSRKEVSLLQIELGLEINRKEVYLFPIEPELKITRKDFCCLAQIELGLEFNQKEVSLLQIELGLQFNRKEKFLSVPERMLVQVISYFLPILFL